MITATIWQAHVRMSKESHRLYVTCLLAFIKLLPHANIPVNEASALVLKRPLVL